MSIGPPYWHAPRMKNGFYDTSRALSSSFRKTQGRKIRKQVKEIYLRAAMPCGLLACTTCDMEEDDSFEEEGQCGERKIFAPLSCDPGSTLLFLDSDVILSQIDFLCEDPCVDNVVICGTALKVVRETHLQTHARVRALCRTGLQDYDIRYNSSLAGRSSVKLAEGRRFFVFPNEFFVETYIPRSTKESASSWQRRALHEVAKWYRRHIMQLRVEQFGKKALEIDEDRWPLVLIITNDSVSKEAALEQGIPAMTVHEYVESVRDRFPTSGEKLAVTEPMMEDEEESRVDPLRRRPVFPAHISPAKITGGIRSKTILQGHVRMARGTCFEGTVSTSSLSEDIRIIGSQHLNRAIDGDLVAVELLNESEANRVMQQGALFFAGEEGEDSPTVAVEEETHKADVSQRSKRTRWDVAENQKIGRVVAIVNRKWRTYCGSLRKLEEYREVGSSLHVRCNRQFIPADPRIPFINIKTRSSTDLEGKRIAVVIDSWDRYSRHPSGHWVEVIGAIDDQETESKVILMEHNIITREFSDAVLRCLPPANWTISPEEAAQRLDLRDKPGFNICSVDPPGCKDIDDALSLEYLPNGNVEVGVSIADVTHFVHPDSAIDAEAAERCTTVYLVERRTDMLPALLTTDLCSLVAGRDRLAFSVFWVMNTKGEVLSQHFAKTCIRSQASLTYEEAQNRIENDRDSSALTKSLRTLNGIAKILRKKRFKQGALELASPEVKFNFRDEGNSDPTDVSIYEMRDTNRMVEEFMLLANISVARKIYEQFPSLSVLRRHPPPRLDALESLKEVLETKGKYDFAFDTSRSLSNSLEKNTGKSPYFNQLLRIMTTRCMNAAVYFCSGEMDWEKYRHYGLATDIYTHFTSPIRRYADILVHRYLAAALGLQPLPDSCTKQARMISQCALMSQKHRDAQWSGRASGELFTYLFFKNKGAVEEIALILRTRKNGVSILVPRYGIESVVRLDPQKYAYDMKAQSLSPNDGSHPPLTPFDQIRVKIVTDKTNYRYKTRVEFVAVLEEEQLNDIHVTSTAGDCMGDLGCSA